MIKTVIVDDVSAFIDVVIHHLSHKSEFHVVHTFTSAIEALEFLSQNEIDLVFLDIDMPDLSGLDLIESLKNKTKIRLPQFILITGHQQFALNGYEYGVIDYIVKPYTYKRFSQAIDRFIEYYELQRKAEGTDMDFFFTDSDGKKVRINFEDIVYVEGSGNYIHIYKKDKRIILLKTMNEIAQILDSKSFIRVHKSYILSLNHIEAIANGELQIKYKNDLVNIPIGRTHKEEVKRRLGIE
jgi:DNA-binding LytR/AlgR family response regulator